MHSCMRWMSLGCVCANCVLLFCLIILSFPAAGGLGGNISLGGGLGGGLGTGLGLGAQTSLGGGTGLGRGLGLGTGLGGGLGTLGTTQTTNL